LPCLQYLTEAIPEEVVARDKREAKNYHDLEEIGKESIK